MDIDKWLHKILMDVANDYANSVNPELDGTLYTGPDLKTAKSQLLAWRDEEVRKELLNWFDLPKHHPGEEYLDQPFVRVKCKTPEKISYYTLDRSFTWAITKRIKELEDKI